MEFEFCLQCVPFTHVRISQKIAWWSFCCFSFGIDSIVIVKFSNQEEASMAFCFLVSFDLLNRGWFSILAVRNIGKWNKRKVTKRKKANGVLVHLWSTANSRFFLYVSNHVQWDFGCLASLFFFFVSRKGFLIPQ